VFQTEIYWTALRYSRPQGAFEDPNERGTTASNRRLLGKLGKHVAVTQLIQRYRPKQLCERGIDVTINGGAVIENVQARVLFNISDLLGTKKLIGAWSATSSKYPCHFCKITTKEVKHKRSAYEPDGFRPKAKAAKILRVIVVISRIVADSGPNL
jgi:hypothetical protein